MPEVFMKERIRPSVTGTLGPYRYISLSKLVDPDTETRLCNVKRHRAETLGVIDYKSDIEITSHLGTHVEGPYHYRDELKNLAELSVDHYIGRGVLLKLDTVEPSGIVRRSDLDTADGGTVRDGDVIILDSPFHHEPFVVSPDDRRPQLGREAAEWCLEKGVKAVGFGDGLAIENVPEECVAFHDILMPHDVTFIEVLKNIELINDRVFMIMFLPMPIHEIDSSITNVVVLEGVPGFTSGK